MPDADDRKKFDRDSVANTLTVAVTLSLVCSVLVASAAVLLKPLQVRNEENFRQAIILDVAGIGAAGVDEDSPLERIEARMVDLERGEFTADVPVDGYDALAAARDSVLGVEVPAELDIAGVRRRARMLPVYVVRDGDAISQVILPVYGAGLWSTMRGYLAVDADGRTVRGLRFYEHAETPGLGDQIDRPAWRAQWSGKLLTDDDGRQRIEVIRGTVDADDPDAIYQVDGLAGATLTGRGVANLLRYWTGPHGFGPFLESLREGRLNDA